MSLTDVEHSGNLENSRPEAETHRRGDVGAVAHHNLVRNAPRNLIRDNGF
jgi:hypothetical protein